MTDKRGFTLIELLVVIAIIGILASILITNITTAIQKTKQKQTMAVIVGIAGACAHYVTDTGYAPAAGSQSGELQAGSDFVKVVSPTYIKYCPLNDQWGHPFLVYTGKAVSGVYNIPDEDTSDDDFLIVSLGRDGEEGGTLTYTYDPNNPSAGLYTLEAPADFNNDLINMNGSWLHAPLRLNPGS
ncbi:MAG: type II secretion system protein [Candidatus Aminicenantales bacterium]